MKLQEVMQQYQACLDWQLVTMNSDFNTIFGLVQEGELTGIYLEITSDVKHGLKSDIQDVLSRNLQELTIFTKGGKNYKEAPTISEFHDIVRDMVGGWFDLEEVNHVTLLELVALKQDYLKIKASELYSVNEYERMKAERMLKLINDFVEVINNTDNYYRILSECDFSNEQLKYLM